MQYFSRTVFIIALCVSFFYGRAQLNTTGELVNKFTPLTPTASALFKSVMYPVSYSNGTVDITLPLYEVKVSDIVLPIKLSYRSSGLKVNQPAGLVGMGWSLIAEPSVSRQVRGGPDETGYLINAGLKTTNTSEYYYYWAKGDIDEEPDDFFYRTLKRSGQFYFKRKNVSNPSQGYNTITSPLAPILISHKTQAMPSPTGDYNFVIKDDDGLIYEFPYANREVTGIDPAYGSSWKASRIYSGKTGAEVSFKYVSDVPVFDHFFQFTNFTSVETFPTSLECNSNPQTYCDFGLQDYDRQSPVIRKNFGMGQTLCYIDYNSHQLVDVCNPMSVYNAYNHSSTSLKNLKEIHFPNGKIVFDYWKRPDQGYVFGALVPVNDSYMVQNMYVYSLLQNGNYSLVRKITFHQNTANWNREILDSITIRTNTNEIIETYRFDYHSTQMPPYPYPYTDHWGYYGLAISPYAGFMGVPYMDVSLPFNSCIFSPSWPLGSPEPPAVQTFIGDYDKYAVENSSKAQVLEKITYPTGGYTTFDYELNAWKKWDETPVEGGGLRIKEIRDYSSDQQPPLVRTFKYGTNEDGMGIGYDADNADYITSKSIYYNRFPTGIWSERRSYLANTLYDYFFAGGLATVYNCVTEYLGTSTANTGKIIYEYNYDDSYKHVIKTRVLGNPYSSLVTDSRLGYLYGELLMKREFKKTDNGYAILRKTKNDYTESSDHDSLHASNRQVYPLSQVVPDVGFNSTMAPYYSYDLADYYISSGVKQLAQEEVTTYAGDDSIKVITKYTYDQATKPIHVRSRKTYTSTGDSIKIVNTFPFDYTQPVTDSMKNRNIMSIIETTKYKNETQELSKIHNGFSLWNNLKLLLPNEVLESTAGNQPERMASYDLYDLKGNLIQFTAKNGPVVTMIWGYNYMYPVARIVGADFNTVKNSIDTATIQTQTGTTLQNTLNNLRNIPGVLVSTYTYEPLIGMTSETSPNGTKLLYEYDGFCRLKRIRDQDNNILKTFDYRYKEQP